MDRVDPTGRLRGEEAQAVLNELRRLRETPPPTDPSAAGCVVAIVALVALVFMPVMTRVLPFGSGGMLALGVGLGSVVVVGTLVGVFGGGFARGAVGPEVDAAVEELVTEFPDGDRAAMRDAAVRILINSTVSSGPSTVRGYDPIEVGSRLGRALPYVLRIERFLLERDEIYPVFTRLQLDEPNEAQDHS